MKAAIFVSAGLGDALLLVPLAKELRKQGVKVSGIFTSPFQCEQLFYNTGVFDEIIISSGGIGSVISSSIKNFRKFDVSYLNFFAGTGKNFLLAKSLSKKIVTNNSNINNPASHLSFIEPVKDIHDAAQNLRLLDPSANDLSLNEEMFHVDFPETKTDAVKFPELNLLRGKKYFAVQISSGNNISPFKNWKTNHWIGFLEQASEKLPEHYFVLLGEPAEAEIGNTIFKSNIPRVCSVAGRTEIPEAVEFIRHAELFIGLDGGLMHIAAAAGKPSFTLWGGSDFNLYGYEKINPLKHKVVFHDIYCRPCNSWIAPNTARVKNPVDCPDYICMQNLTPDFAFSEFRKFYNKLFHA